jgi:hypothetical protein
MTGLALPYGHEWPDGHWHSKRSAKKQETEANVINNSIRCHGNAIGLFSPCWETLWTAGRSGCNDCGSMEELHPTIYGGYLWTLLMRKWIHWNRECLCTFNLTQKIDKWKRKSHASALERATFFFISIVYFPLISTSQKEGKKITVPFCMCSSQLFFC